MVGETPPGSIAGAPASPALSSFTCPGCGAAVTIHVTGGTLTAACSACGALCDQTNGTFVLVSKSLAKMLYKPAITLGTKGKIRGDLFMVIGYMVRSEEDEPRDSWEEYLLYNPYQGYAWLAVYQGHWTLYKTTKNAPKLLADRLSYDFHGEKYDVFHRGKAVVRFVIGEFYWRVRAGNSAQISDAICPPHIISCEKSDDEVIWSYGDYVLPEEVKAAFNPNPLPVQIGVAPNQPITESPKSQYWAVWVVAFFILIFVQARTSGIHHQPSAVSTNIEVNSKTPADQKIAEFTIDSITKYVMLHIDTNLNQSWVNVDLRIVGDNPANTKKIEFSNELSYYRGYDSDGPWSEGSQGTSFLLNNLAFDHYAVYLTATTDPAHPTMIMTSLEMEPNIWSNFWLALIPITAVPLWVMFRYGRMEHQRWSNSEFNPFEKNEI